MAYVEIGKKTYTVYKNTKGRLYYIKDGKRHYTKKSPMKGKKPRNVSRTPGRPKRKSVKSKRSRKSASKKSSRKSVAKRSSRKSASKRGSRKSASKKSASKRSSSRKSASKKSASKRSSRKSSSKKSATKKSSRKSSSKKSASKRSRKSVLKSVLIKSSKKIIKNSKIEPEKTTKTAFFSQMKPVIIESTNKYVDLLRNLSIPEKTINKEKRMFKNDLYKISGQYYGQLLLIEKANITLDDKKREYQIVQNNLAKNYETYFNNKIRQYGGKYKKD